MIHATRKIHFCAAHRLHQDNLSPEDNRRRFGECVHEHGHNYTAEVTVAGDADPRTGMLVHCTELDRLVSARAIDMLDHKNLSVDVDDLRDAAPTVERMAKFIWQRVEGAVEGARLFRVRVREDDGLFADYYGE